MGTTTWGDQPPLVYFAEPIDKAAGLNFQLAAEMHGTLSMWGCTVYRPSAAWRARHPDPRVEQINRSALYQADAIVAYLDENTPSIGVPAEIEAATARGIPAVVHYTGQSFALAGNPLVTVIDSPTSVIQILEQALKEHPREERPPTAIHPTAAMHEAAHVMADGGILTAAQYTQAFRPDDPPPFLGSRLIRDAYEKITANTRYDQPLRNPIRLQIADGAQPPARAYHDDAGIDLTTARETTIEPGQYVDIHTQVTATQLPPGYWGMITGRSSALRKWRLHIPIAIIDPGWRGPLFVGVWNLGGNPVTVKPGDRLGQLILIPNNPAPVLAVTQVDEHPRGLNGFGSSG